MPPTPSLRLDLQWCFKKCGASSSSSSSSSSASRGLAVCQSRSYGVAVAGKEGGREKGICLRPPRESQYCNVHLRSRRRRRRERPPYCAT